MKKLLILTSAILFLAAACNKQAVVQPVSNPHPATDQTANWKTYANAKYGFEVQYPADWKVFESLDNIAPSINIYKTGTPPLSDFSNETQVSIFPLGMPTEGPAGDSKQISKQLIKGLNQRVSAFYLSNNNEISAYYISFITPPKNWDTSGFIWTSLQIKNRTLTDATPNPDAMQSYHVSGEVDASGFSLIDQILSTFKFTK